MQHDPVRPKTFLERLKENKSFRFSRVFYTENFGDRHYLKDYVKAKLNLESGDIKSMMDQLTSIRF